MTFSLSREGNCATGCPGSASLTKLPGARGGGLLVGASRQSARDYFLEPIKHYVYAGDTLLHVAAAAYAMDAARALVLAGADVRARNRRGAEPLHYAADG